MPSIIKVKGSAIDVTTANTVSDAPLVRVFAAAAATVTVANTGGTIGTIKMPAGGVEYIEKEPTDTIAGSGTLSCTPVAYKA